MHDTARAAGAAFFAAYLPSAPARVLEVGSFNVNGGFRDDAPAGVEYVGVDLEAGPGVDVVIRPGDPLPFPAASFDACVSGNCFEHDAAFWDSFCQMVRVTRPGGYVMAQSISNGPYHAFPHDYWRFYPDAGLALVAWARRQGLVVSLVESGLNRQAGDQWNDFAAVFQVQEVPDARERWLFDAFPDAVSLRRAGVDGLIRHDPAPEDLRNLLMARHERDQALSRAEAAEAALAAGGTAEAALRAELDALRASTSWRLTAPLRVLGRLLGR